MSPKQIETLLPSYVVHTSVDPSVPKTATTANEEEDEAGDPDRVITGARWAIDTDGLLTVPELEDFFAKLPKARSAYDEGLSQTAKENGITTFGKRVPLPSNKHGYNEPEYTSYTHWWKTTLGDSHTCIWAHNRLTNGV